MPERTNKQLKSSFRNFATTFIVASLLCIILYYIKVPNPDISIEARIKQLDYKLEAPITIGNNTDIYLSEIQLFNIDSCNVIPFKKDFPIIIKNGLLRLDELLFKPNTKITLSVDKNELLIFAENNNVRGVINAKNAFVTSGDSGVNKQIGNTDSGAFIHFETTLNPRIYLRSKRESLISVPKAMIKSIGFISSPDNSSQNYSTIESGKMVICGIEHELKKGEILAIESFTNGQLEILKIEENFLKISAKFKTSSIKENLNKKFYSLKPSILECFYKNNKIIFWVFTIFSSIFSFFYPTIKLFFASSEEE